MDESETAVLGVFRVCPYIAEATNPAAANTYNSFLTPSKMDVLASLSIILQVNNFLKRFTKHLWKNDGKKQKKPGKTSTKKNYSNNCIPSSFIRNHHTVSSKSSFRKKKEFKNITRKRVAEFDSLKRNNINPPREINKYSVPHSAQEDYQAVLKESFEHIFWGEEIYATFAGFFQVNIQYGKPGDAGNMIPNELAEYYRGFIHEMHICAHIDCE